MSNEGFNIRLMSLYGKSGMFDHAQKVFDEIPDRNIEPSTKTMNALLSACVSSGKIDKIEGLFVELQERLGVKPDTVWYNVVIKGCCKCGKVEKAVKMYGEMEKNGVKPDLVTFNTVLVGLYSSKRFLEGEKMWRRMIETGLKPDIRSWNARIIGYVNEKRFDEAVKALSELERTGLKPDAFSYRALVKGYCDEENLKGAKKWYAEFVRCEHPDKVTLETVISLAMKKGDLSWAVELCKVIFDRKWLVNAQILQEVVDTLVKDSRFQDAKRIVEMGNTNSYRCYKLNLPSEQ
ncbi:hypothetical protein LIER_13765 [Lithospermum erythrorhizon]|uniref:Pentatricopeptide repeat-containing protein n=1 Tax=Lithospermum erythrorhizon TaxID=34254 RepID=A0AAV3PY96_LITER